jgi:flagellar protein FlaF
MSADNALTDADRFADARTMEYVLLGQISGAMVLADKNPDDREVLESVVHYNKNLWETWLTDLQHRDNRLPRELKLSLGQLATWVTQESKRVLDGHGSCRNLVKVNQLIMAGLAPRPDAVAPGRAGGAALTA